MVRPLAALVFAALLSTTAAASGDSAVFEPGAQAKPKPAAPRTNTQKPAPKPAAPVAAKLEVPPPPPATDVRMKTASTQGAQVSQNTTYLQGARQRVEFPGVVTLDQCDLKRSVMLNTAAKKYRVQPYPEASVPTPAAAPAAAAPLDAQSAQLAQMLGTAQPAQPAEKTRGGVVTFTTTLSDTLERQPMLGLEARRIKTLVIKQSSSSACDKSPMKIEVDAWYVDLPAQSGCTRAAATPAAPAAPPDPGDCIDRIETRVAGDVKLGFPIKSVTTSTTGEGNRLEVTSSSSEVTELEITRLDRALFEVPAGYVEANSSAEIVPALATGGSLADALFGSTADGSSTAAPKKPGIIRIGVLEPINKTARDLPPSSLRQDLVAKFNKAPYEAIPVAGNSPAAIEQDAARMQCDYIMLTEIVDAKTSKPGRMSGVTRMTGGTPKDSHDVKLDYKLYAVGATESPRISGNAKASNGGFGVGSALRLAAFAGQMYMSLMMGGMGMGMMNPMMAMSGMGGLGTTGGGLFDPRASAMSSIFMGDGGSMMTGMGAMPGMSSVADPSEAGMRDTVSEALGNGAKSAMEQLGKKK
jgi:hypothetical protein